MRQYIIRDKSQYWSNEDGWVTRSEATVFSEDDKETFNLPIGGEWVVKPDDNPKDLWEHNSVQFPRLISEIMATGVSEEQWDDLLTSMDLESDDLSELFDRAQEEWESIKNRHCPPSKSS